MPVVTCIVVLSHNVYNMYLSADVIKVLRKGIDNDSFDMIIRRSNVLSDALRRMERLLFDPQKKLNVRV